MTDKPPADNKAAITPEKAAPPPRPPPHEALKDRVPVKTLWFSSTGGPMIPGRMGQSSVSHTFDGRSNRDHHTIEWVPAMRAFAVTFYEAAQKKTHLRYVGEASVRDWEPLL